QTKSNRAPAQEGIHFLGHAYVGHEFVAAQIQSPDHNRVRLERGSDRAKSLVLFLFGWEGGSIQKQIFGPKKANTFRAGFFDGFDISGTANIRREDDPLAIKR